MKNRSGITRLINRLKNHSQAFFLGGGSDEIVLKLKYGERAVSDFETGNFNDDLAKYSNCQNKSVLC